MPVKSVTDRNTQMSLNSPSIDKITEELTSERNSIPEYMNQVAFQSQGVQASMMDSGLEHQPSIGAVSARGKDSSHQSSKILNQQAYTAQEPGRFTYRSVQELGNKLKARLSQSHQQPQKINRRSIDKAIDAINRFTIGHSDAKMKSSE